jgi:hypothetical protein
MTHFASDEVAAAAGDPMIAAALAARARRAGSLDNPSAFRPSQDIFTASAQPRDHMDPDLPKAAKLPDASATLNRKPLPG